MTLRANSWLRGEDKILYTASNRYNFYSYPLLLTPKWPSSQHLHHILGRRACSALRIQLSKPPQGTLGRRACSALLGWAVPMAAAIDKLRIGKPWRREITKIIRTLYPTDLLPGGNNLLPQGRNGTTGSETMAVQRPWSKSMEQWKGFYEPLPSSLRPSLKLSRRLIHTPQCKSFFLCLQHYLSLFLLNMHSLCFFLHTRVIWCSIKSDFTGLKTLEKWWYK